MLLIDCFEFNVIDVGLKDFMGFGIFYVIVWKRISFFWRMVFFVRRRWLKGYFVIGKVGEGKIRVYSGLERVIWDVKIK